MKEVHVIDDGVITIFASDFKEVCIKVEPGITPGCASFTPANARLIALAISKMADELEK